MSKQENQEWQQNLRTGSDEVKKQTMQEIILAMTAQRDVSWIFSDVVKTIFTKDLELKKLVYLYLEAFAEKQPETSILAVNAFLKDCDNQDSSIIRALAIRTMASIPLEQVAEYICEPLQKLMRDNDPYVRKTAALAAAKLIKINPEASEQILSSLTNLALDSNQAVVANAVSALLDISNNNFEASEEVFESILAATSDCNEWGLVQLLEALVYLKPKDVYDALAAIEKVTTKLQHANPAVVINAIKAVLHICTYLDDEQRQQYVRRITPPFITLLSTESPEIQFLTLRSASSVLAAFPGWLHFDIRVVLPKYHDLLYVKMEKLDVLLQIADDSNAQLILQELKDYCISEVDQVFVKKCVRLIGKIAIKLVNASGIAVQTLVDLVQMVSGNDTEEQAVFVETDGQNSTSYTAVAQEALIAIRDVVRCFPGYFDAAILKVLASITKIDDPEARAALFYVIGSHCQQIENSFDLLQDFADNFADEPENVQLSLLTAAVKVFLQNPTEASQKLVQDLLQKATSFGDQKAQKACSPDVRERAYFYWRLLSLDNFETARKVVFGGVQSFNQQKAVQIVDQMDAFYKFVPNLGRYSSISRQAVRKVIEKKEFVENDEEEIKLTMQGLVVEKDPQLAEDAARAAAGGSQSARAQGKQEFTGSAQQPLQQPAAAAAPPKNDLDDLLGF